MESGYFFLWEKLLVFWLLVFGVWLYQIYDASNLEHKMWLCAYILVFAGSTIVLASSWEKKKRIRGGGETLPSHLE